MSAPNPRGLDTADLSRAKAFIAQVDAKFRYAKTLPEHPHEYLVRSWLPSDLQAEFDWFCRLIAKHGYRGTFWQQTWVYLSVDEWRYWQSKSWFGDGGKILNRARASAPANPRRASR
jgi:hypothetical protein